MLKKLYDLKMIYLIRVVDLDPDPSVLGVFFLRVGYGSAFFLTVEYDLTIIFYIIISKEKIKVELY